MKKCTCIIPIYNEANRLKNVVDELIKAKGVGEIICVDDASTDGSLTLIKSRYPKIKLITLAVHSGKSEAIRKGLKEAKNQNILLIDADLQNFRYEEAEKVIKAFETNAVDMIIMRRVRADFSLKIVRVETFLSGERILKKNDLEKIFVESKPNGYQIEVAINQYMIDKGKEVFWMPSSAVSTYPIYKMGLLKGLRKSIFMNFEMIGYIGLIPFIKQLLFFCRKKLPSDRI